MGGGAPAPRGERPPAGEVPPDSREPVPPSGELPGGPQTGGDGTGGPQTGGDGVGGPTTGGDGGTGGPETGGGGGGGAPTPGSGGPTGGAPTPGRMKGQLVMDRDDWKYWWFANRTELLDLHARATAQAARTAASSRGPRPGEEMWRADAQRALAGALRDPEYDVVAAAAISLGKSGDAGEGRTLTKILLDGTQELVVRKAAALALGLLPPGDEAASVGVRDALRSVAGDRKEREELRASAVYALGERGEDASVPALIDLARSGGARWDVPAAALSALGIARCAATRTELERLLVPPKKARDKEWMRRVYAAHGLARLRDRASIPPLLEASRDDHVEVRRAAILALGSLGTPLDKEVRDRLASAMDDDHDRPCRNMAALSLGRIGGKGVTSLLRKAYDGGDPIHRTYAAIAMGFLAREDDDATIRTFLHRELRERSMVELRGALCVAVGLSNAHEARATLREIASSPGDAGLRSHASLALGLLGDHDAAPLLRELLQKKGEPDLQGEAALALGLLGDRASLDALAENVEHGSSHRVQAAAAVALGRIGGAQAANLFARLVTDRTVDEEVREAAAIGLGLLLDRRDGRSYTEVGADLDWYATTFTVREILDVQWTSIASGRFTHARASLGAASLRPLASAWARASLDGSWLPAAGCRHRAASALSHADPFGVQASAWPLPLPGRLQTPHRTSNRLLFTQIAAAHGPATTQRIADSRPG